MHSEPVKLPKRPSEEYIQALRDIGASEETIRLAMGLGRPGLLRRLLHRTKQEETQ